MMIHHFLGALPVPAPISNIVRVFQFDEPIVEAMRNKRANALFERSKKTAVADLNQFPSNKAVRITLPNGSSSSLRAKLPSALPLCW